MTRPGHRVAALIPIVWPFSLAAPPQSARLYISIRRILRGLNETARFHHGSWYCGYVATRGPSTTTGEDEADCLGYPGGQSQRIERER